MNLQPFRFDIAYNREVKNIEVRPCCKPGNVIFYDIWLNGRYQFTITYNGSGDYSGEWKVALKDSDRKVDDVFVDLIGAQIDERLVQSTP